MHKATKREAQHKPQTEEDMCIMDLGFIQTIKSEK